MIWTVYLGNFHPLPFIGFSLIFSDFVMLTCFKKLFPTQLRIQKDFKNQANWYILYRLWILGVAFQQDALMAFSNAMPSSLQFLLAALIPILREGNSWIVSKISKKSPGTNLKMMDVLVTSNITVMFTYLLATRLPSLNQETVYFILFVDFALYLRHCFQIILIHRKIGAKE